jgi:hypothetical protein
VFQGLNECLRTKARKSGAIEDMEMTDKAGRPQKLDMDATVTDWEKKGFPMTA